MKTSVKKCGIWAGLLLGTAVAASAIPVSFQVDMSVQIANATFNPTGGDTVQARGSFQSPSQWTGGFTLTNNPVNTNLWQGTYDDANGAGTGEQFKFVIVVAGDDVNSWNHGEGIDNRAFTLVSGGTTLTPVYYNNLAPSSGVPTHPVTFQVNLSVQVSKGNFDPSTGTVEARGVFQSPNQWSGGFTLTNSPGNPNIYTGTYADGNYPGTVEGYKFVLNGGNYESLPNNRTFTQQAGGVTLPVAYFNNDIGTLVPVTFQVDMSVQILTGHFNPAADTVQARGAFQSPTSWTGGFTLTNSPGNTNLYTGTYLVASAPGTAEEFKYVIVKAGDDVNSWNNGEGRSNRGFTLGSSAQTLPAAYFNDVNIHDILTADTWVTFTVNMTNAVGYLDGITFAPPHGVWLNGDFVPWYAWNSAPAAYQMTNSGAGDMLYSLTLLIPKGNSLALTYKYGIDSADDEAGFAQNHVRYIRATGNYTMPLDRFGAQIVEPLVGSLTVGAKSAGHVPVSWNGRPGIHLQTSGNLTTWQDLPATDGLSSTNYPVGAGATFFRLVKP